MSIRSSSQRGKVYKFIHKEDEYIITTITGKQFKPPQGLIELTEDGKLFIMGSLGNGYAWDGCTPKWEILDFTIGTPDGRFDYLTQKQIAYYASMIHDVIYQYKADIPISRKDADLIFYKILKEAGFLWSLLYYIVVRIAGRFFGKWKTKGKSRSLRIIECSWINKAYEESLKLNIKELVKHPLVITAKNYKKKQNGE